MWKLRQLRFDTCSLFNRYEEELPLVASLWIGLEAHATATQPSATEQRRIANGSAAFNHVAIMWPLRFCPWHWRRWQNFGQRKKICWAICGRRGLAFRTPLRLQNHTQTGQRCQRHSQRSARHLAGSPTLQRKKNWENYPTFLLSTDTAHDLGTPPVFTRCHTVLFGLVSARSLEGRYYILHCSLGSRQSLRRFVAGRCLGVECTVTKGGGCAICSQRHSTGCVASCRFGMESALRNGSALDLVGQNRSCGEQPLGWLNNPIFAWQPLPLVSQTKLETVWIKCLHLLPPLPVLSPVLHLLVAFLLSRIMLRNLLPSSASSSQVSTSMSVSLRLRLQTPLKRTVLGNLLGEVLWSARRTGHPSFGAHVPAIAAYADIEGDACSGSRVAPSSMAALMALSYHVTPEIRRRRGR